jgi:uncharacterized membrane protein YqjE
MRPAPAPAVHRANTQRAIGMAMLGLSMAVLLIAALMWAGLLAVSDGIRGWAMAGMATAAIIDGSIGLYFLRASS